MSSDGGSQVGCLGNKCLVVGNGDLCWGGDRDGLCVGHYGGLPRHLVGHLHLTTTLLSENLTELADVSTLTRRG